MVICIGPDKFLLVNIMTEALHLFQLPSKDNDVYLIIQQYFYNDLYKANNEYKVNFILHFYH